MISAAALAAYEAKTGKPICQSFDMIGGTSVGAIIGAPLACGIPAENIVNFFNTEAPKIFTATLWHRINRLSSAALYDPAPLKDALVRLLGTRTLADCKVPFMATGVDMKSGRNVYFQSHGKGSEDDTEIVMGPESGVLLSDVILGSSAAPSYFPGHPLGPLLLWDGGSSGCNCPDMLLLTESLAMGVPMDQTSMLSLGAGCCDWKYSNRDLTDPSIATVLEATLEIVYSCGETNECWQARSLLNWGKGTYRRISPYIDNYGIDDASEATLAALAKAAALNPI